MAKKPTDVRVCLAIILVGAFLVVRGVGIVSQTMPSLEVSSGLPELRNSDRVDAAAPAEISGLRLSSRSKKAERFLDGPLNLDTIRPAAEAVTDVLRVWPLAAPYWLRLADIKAASGDSLDTIVAAYQLSVHTAPFDGQMMMARQVLGVQLWDVLSPDDRRAVVTDLVTVWNSRPALITQLLRDATVSLSPEGRKDLRISIKLRARLSDQQLASIGL